MKPPATFTLTALVSLVWIPAATGVAVPQEKASPLKQQLVGSWTLVDVSFEWQDGRRTHPYGPNAKGRLVLDQHGLFGFQVIGADRPKCKSSNRRERTPAENATVVRLTELFSGTYSVNDADHTIPLHLDRAMFPNWDGTDRKDRVVFKGGEMLTVGPPTPSATGSYIPHQLWKRPDWTNAQHGPVLRLAGVTGAVTGVYQASSLSGALPRGFLPAVPRPLIGGVNLL